MELKDYITKLELQVFRVTRKRGGGIEHKIITFRNDVYNDQLQEVFTRMTGLHTRL